MGKATFLLAFFFAAPVLPAGAPPPIAIRNARIVTVSGPAIAKGTVVVRNGLIEAVGENVAPPADAWVVDGEGLTVYPGLIDALSTWGIPEAAPATPAAGAITSRRSLATPPAPSTPAPTPAEPSQPSQPARGPEDRPATTSWAKAADLVQPTDRRLESARSAGFTSAVTFPTRGIFAGQGAVIDLAGERGGQMVVASPAGMYLSLGSAGFTSFPGSLMGVIAYIRQVYIDAAQYRQAKDFYAHNSRGYSRPPYDRALEGVLEAPRVLLPATRAVEIDRMIRFAAELKTPSILYGMHEAYRAADLLAKTRQPVLVSLKWPERQPDSDPDQEEALRVLEMREKAPGAPFALVKAGVPFAFYSDGIERPRDILRAVKRAIDAGLAQGAAVRAMTLAPAEIYGVADRMGSIEKGKIANLLVTKGDLFLDRTEVKFVLIDGVKYEPVPEADLPMRPPGAGAPTGPPPMEPPEQEVLR